jgi:hypothetical protein
MQIKMVFTPYPARTVAFATLFLLLVGSAVAQKGASAKTGMLTAFVNAVVAHGPSSELPPHLSLVLGLNPAEQPTAVKQAIARDGNRVRTFNVRTDNHDDIVVMLHDSQTRSTQAFLTNAWGKLRKTVSYQDGEAPSTRTVHEAQADFAAEIAFWNALSRRSATAPPK